MRNKLIAAGIGLFGYGLSIGWAVTGDHFESKMKRNQRLLGDVISRQTSELDRARELLINASLDENKLSSDGMQRMSEIMSNEMNKRLDRLQDEAVTRQTNYSDVPMADSDVPEGETPDETQSRLQNLIDSYTADPDAVNTFVDSAQYFEDYGETSPFVISQQLYSWDEQEGDNYAKVTLTYYPREDILLDDDNELIEKIDHEAHVGTQALRNFGGESGDPNVVFVRNRRLQTDFEVVRDTENLPPIHVRHGMGKDEYDAENAAGLIKFRESDV